MFFQRLGPHQDRHVRSTAVLGYALISLCGVTAQPARSADLNAPIATTSLAEADRWHGIAGAYLWGTSLSGKTGIGDFTPHVYASFPTLLQDLKFGYMGYAEARKGDVTLFTNIVYTLTEGSKSVGIGRAQLTTGLTIVGAGALYRLYEAPVGATGATFNLSPYVGARVSVVSPTLELSAPAVTKITYTQGENYSWVDPYVGLRTSLIISPNLNFELAGDIGAISKEQWSYSVQGVMGYRPSFLPPNWSTYLGYRLLHQEYVSGSGPTRFTWDMNLYGPIMGIGYKF